MRNVREKRREGRFRFRNFVQYEKVFEDGSFGISVNTRARDIGKEGMGFYAEEKLELNSKVRIKFSILQDEDMSYIGRVKRIEISEKETPKYIIGIEAENMSGEVKAKIGRFLRTINIYDVFDRLNLEGVLDIHLICGSPPILKKGGVTEIADMESFDEYSLNALLLNMLDEEQYEKFIKSKEFNYIFDYREESRFRVNLYIQQQKIEGVFRLIPRKINLPHQLGLPSVVEKLLEDRKGLILVAGRTGSGKTTTLASMVEFLNRTVNGVVLSIEDPIEYIHTNNKCIIAQREVGRDTLSFSAAARNALRQNPDILVIGEILDEETMEIALTAAESGTLVLTSIHGITSSQVLGRIASFFPIDARKHVFSRLSLILRSIIIQELIPRLDRKDFVIAVEILVINDAMRRIIRDGDWKAIPTAILGGRKLGMQSMQESIEILYRDGIIGGEYLKRVIL